MARIVLMPRWGGDDTSDWYPWLRERMPEADLIIATLLPEPGAPVIDDCITELRRIVGVDPSRLVETLLVGHSVGCQAMIRFLATLPDAVAVKGLVCIAGWFWVDEPWPTLMPWQAEPIDDPRIRAAAPDLRVLLSDDDPFTSDHMKNADTWRTRLDAQVTIHPGRRHYNEPEEPLVLEAIEQALHPIVPPTVG